MLLGWPVFLVAKNLRSMNPEAYGKVLGFMDDAGDVHAALPDLQTAGFASDEIEALAGEEEPQRLEVNGNHHGLLTHVVRSIPKIVTMNRTCQVA